MQKLGKKRKERTKEGEERRKERKKMKLEAGIHIFYQISSGRKRAL